MFFTSFSKSTLHLVNDLLTNYTEYPFEDCREYLLKSLDGVSNAIQMHKDGMDHHLARVGGTGLAMDSLDKLPEVEPPFLPTINSQNYKFTLVLDLDETLVHYFQTEDDGKCLLRPHVESFLEEMSKYYELVIFTAAMKDYADWVIDQIDPEGYIKYRLYRQHALPCGSIFLKDLSRIGRDLNKMIIVDNIPENFTLQPDNGIFIKSWFDDVHDIALLELMPILKEIARKDVSDVRLALRILRDQMIEQLNAQTEHH